MSSQETPKKCGVCDAEILIPESYCPEDDGYVKCMSCGALYIGSARDDLVNVVDRALAHIGEDMKKALPNIYRVMLCPKCGGVSKSSVVGRGRISRVCSKCQAVIPPNSSTQITKTFGTLKSIAAITPAIVVDSSYLVWYSKAALE